MVSIILPNYNRVTYLEQALNSILAQTYIDWEAIVIDDGSSDGSKKLVEALTKKDSRIRWIARQIEPKGAATCRNIGIEKAKGTYIIFLDSDDVLAPYCLKRRVEFMEANSNLDFSVYKMQIFNETPGDDTHVWNLENDEPILERFLKLDSVWQTSGPIWKHNALKKINGFDVSLSCWQDIDIHLKALFANLTYQICYELPADCYYRKDSTDSISQSNTNSLNKLESKKTLFFWAQTKANAISLDVSNMALHILASAINGHQFHFFWKFYKEVKLKLSSDTQNMILKMAYIKRYRLNKLPYFQSYYLKLKKRLITESSIGQYEVSLRYQGPQTINPFQL